MREINVVGREGEGGFERDMLDHLFHGIKLNSLTSTMLNFWEKDFDQAIEKHINFLKENLENQQKYSSKFSEILQKMDILQNEEDEQKNSAKKVEEWPIYD